MELCLMSCVPKVIVLVGTAVNPLHTVFFVVKLTSVGPAGCVQSQVPVKAISFATCSMVN